MSTSSKAKKALHLLRREARKFFGRATMRMFEFGHGSSHDFWIVTAPDGSSRTGYFPRSARNNGWVKRSLRDMRVALIRLGILEQEADR